MVLVYMYYHVITTFVITVLIYYQVLPFITEHPIENTFHFGDIFNNLSLHVIGENELNTADQSFWDHHPEPHYKNDVDIIQTRS